MRQKTSGVDLRSLLREAFVRLGDEPPTGEERLHPAGPAAPVQRSSEDRSRTRQMVLEELARRREREAVAEHHSCPPVGRKIANTVQTESLFVASGCCDQIRIDIVPSGRSVASASAFRRVRTDVRDLVTAAYQSLMRRLPEDHVILNPIANAEFIVRCRELGATVSEVVLNRTLLNNRKAKRHADLFRESVPGLAPGVFDQIGHAVEIAASLVQREWFAVGDVVPSVDDILCNPDLRRALREYVGALRDHVDPVDCHLVLLAFRKSGRRPADRLVGLDLPSRGRLFPLRTLDPKDVPAQGVYRVLCRNRPVFVSGTTSLRARIREHMDLAGEGFLPTSLPFQVDGPLTLEVFATPGAAPRSELDALARSLKFMRTEHDVPAPPDLNWRQSGSMFSSQDCVVPRLAAVG